MQSPCASAEDSDSDKIYTVETILDTRMKNGIREYFIRWSSPYSSPEYDTWEPEENLINCADLIEEFINHRNRQNESSSSSTSREHQEPLSLNDDISSARSTNSTPTATGASNPTATTSGKNAAAIHTDGKQRSRKQRQYWTMVPETELVKRLREPFWKDLEEGRIDFDHDDGSLTERVKRRRGAGSVADRDAIAISTRRRAAVAAVSGRETASTATTSNGHSTAKVPTTRKRRNVKKEADSSNSTNDTTVEDAVNHSKFDEIFDSIIQNRNTKSIQKIKEPPIQMGSNNENGESSISQRNSEASGSTSEVTQSYEGTEKMDTSEVDLMNASGDSIESFSSFEIVDEVCELSDLDHSNYVPEENLVRISKPSSPTSNSAQEESNTSSVMDTDQKPIERSPEQKESPTQISPVPVSRSTSGGQWLPMKKQNAKAKLVIDEPIDCNQSTSMPVSNDTPSTSAIAPETLQAPIINQLIIPELPFPVLLDPTVGDFFKFELIRQHQPPQADKLISNDYDFTRACLTGQVDAVYETLQAMKRASSQIKINKDARNEYGNTILMQICERKCGPTHELDDILHILASNGVNLNARNDHGDTALTVAIRRNQECKIIKLLSFGASMNLPNHMGETPLMLACKKNCVSIIHRLLDYGADFNAESAQQKTALDFAIDVYREGRGRSCENAMRSRSDKIIQAFHDQLRLVLPMDQYSIMHPLFPLHCYALRESHMFRIVFKYHEIPEKPTAEMLHMLAIGMCRSTTNRLVDCRFWGPTPVESVHLNGVEQKPVTNAGKFLFSFWPIRPDLNELIIVCNKACRDSQHKLLIDAFSLRILGVVE